MRWTLVCAGLFPAVVLAAAAERPVLAVTAFEARGATELEAEAATRGAVRGLRALDVFQILGNDEIRELLAIERQRALLGQEGQGIALEVLNGALGARHVVTGVMTKVGTSLQVDLRLLDSQSGKVLSQKTLGPVKGVEDVARELPGLAQELVAPLLEAQQGGLLVRTQEEGAELLVDDVLRGSTPLAQPLPLSRGTHRLQVRKDGFIAQTKAVRIAPDEVTIEDVTLVPSADYAEAWKLRHGRLRTGAWIATVVAVGALGGALYLDRQTEAAYQNEFLPQRMAVNEDGSRDALEPGQVGAYDACMAQGRTACAAGLKTLQGQLSAQQYGTAGLIGLGAVATGAAVYLWISGEDPNRYAGLVAGVSAGPSPGLVVSGRF